MSTKTNKKSSKKAKPVRSEDYEINSNVTLSCYEWDNRRTAKLTIADSFVIFCTIVVYKGEYFLSYPSYKNKNDDYSQLAYCYDKKIIGKINKALEDFCTGAEDDE